MITWHALARNKKVQGFILGGVLDRSYVITLNDFISIHILEKDLINEFECVLANL